jgi:hypothetical protein
MEADITVVGINGVHQQPAGNPFDTLIFSSSGRDVLELSRPYEKDEQDFVLLVSLSAGMFRPRHAGPRLALSTFYGAHRRYRLFLIGRDDRQVSLLNDA